MPNNSITLEDVLHILEAHGFIQFTTIQPPEKPGHGPCCTCQDCGRPYDECVCDDNALIKTLTRHAEVNSKL